jgi:hypothetical protein
LEISEGEGSVVAFALGVRVGARRHVLRVVHLVEEGFEGESSEGIRI